jgi:hypothetical protein
MNIHDLKEHESMLIKVSINSDNERGKGGKSGEFGNAVAYPYVWQVTRVATGFIYQNANPNATDFEGYFVPLDITKQ